MRFDLSNISWQSVVENLGWAALSLLVTSGLFAFVARAYFERWLNAKFEAQLQASKHDQNIEVERLKGALIHEIEKLKGRVNAQADRRLRMHQYEFDTLPRLWELLDTAYTDLAQVLIGFDQHDDLSNYDEDRLRTFSETRKYTGQSIRYLIDAEDKNSAVARIEAHRRRKTSNESIWELRRFNAKNRIFWPPELSDEIEEILAEMTETVVFNETDERPTAPLQRRYIELRGSYLDSSRKRLAAVELIIKERLNLDLFKSVL